MARKNHPIHRSQATKTRVDQRIRQTLTSATTLRIVTR